MSGWIKIHRDIKSHWVYDNSEYFKAWITILLEVNHADSKKIIEGELVECKRGQSIKSIQTWTAILGDKWTRQKVRTFFKLLEKDQMINQQGLRKTTKLSVCNYATYQSKQPTDNPQNNQEITKRKPRDNHKQEETTITKNNKEVEDVLLYLNEKTNKGFKVAKGLLKRFSEGYTVDDAKKVIDNKINDWGEDDKMKQYIKPSTLFSEKFDGYLNDAPSEINKPSVSIFDKYN